MKKSLLPLKMKKIDNKKKKENFYTLAVKAQPVAINYQTIMSSFRIFHLTKKEKFKIRDGA